MLLLIIEPVALTDLTEILRGRFGEIFYFAELSNALLQQPGSLFGILQKAGEKVPLELILPCL